jgi:hypothetical protein
MQTRPLAWSSPRNLRQHLPLTPPPLAAPADARVTRRMPLTSLSWRRGRRLDESCSAGALLCHQRPRALGLLDSCPTSCDVPSHSSALSSLEAFFLPSSQLDPWQQSSQTSQLLLAFVLRPQFWYVPLLVLCLFATATPVQFSQAVLWACSCFDALLNRIMLSTSWVLHIFHVFLRTNPANQPLSQPTGMVPRQALGSQGCPQ